MYACHSVEARGPGSQTRLALHAHTAHMVLDKRNLLMSPMNNKDVYETGKGREVYAARCVSREAHGEPRASHWFKPIQKGEKGAMRMVPVVALS